MMLSHEIHAALARRWPAVLVSIGIAEKHLTGEHTSCPACGGKDRFRFDNRNRRGDYYCNGCGAGDGFKLVMRVLGLQFGDARVKIMEAAGLKDDEDEDNETHDAAVESPTLQERIPEASRAAPTSRVREILRGACDPADVDDVREYLEARRLWPLPEGCGLRAHASVEYWNAEHKRVGRYPALAAPIRDIDGELVSLHVTYLQNGWKLTDHEPRKILSKLTGRNGCAARLMPLTGDVLGIAEGIETALSAWRSHDVTTWAALNTSLLAKFEPPPQVRKLIVFADRDVPGLEAAAKLMQSLQGRVRVELRAPSAPAKDWADVLMGDNNA